MDSLKKNQKKCIKSNEFLLKYQQRFRSEKHNIFTEDIEKIANDDKRTQSIDLMEKYAYGTNKEVVGTNMINFDCVAKEKIKKQKTNWLQIPDHPYRILIIGSPGLVKTNSLLTLINNKLYVDKIFSYAEDPFETKYLFFINKQEDAS